MRIVDMTGIPCSNTRGTRNISVDFFNEKKHYITKVVLEELDSEWVHEYTSTYTTGKDGNIDVKEPIKVTVKIKGKNGDKQNNLVHNTYGMDKVSSELLEDVHEIDEMFDNCFDKKVYM